MLDEEHGLRIKKAKQQQRDYDAWKERMLADQAQHRRKKHEAAEAAALGEQQRQEGLPAPDRAKKLKQATLSFGSRPPPQQAPSYVSNKENV